MGRYNNETNKSKQKTLYHTDSHKQNKRKTIERICKGLNIFPSTLNKYNIKLADIPHNKYDTIHVNVMKILSIAQQPIICSPTRPKQETILNDQLTQASIVDKSIPN